MHKRQLRSLLFATFAAVLLFAWGCSTNANGTSDEVPAEQKLTDEVDAEELADNPCGDADWDEPPPEATSLED